MARGTREATRERLLSAASAVFSERGYAGTSVDAIAERAGLTTGALYSNFAGKREIFLSALRLAVGQPGGYQVSPTQSGISLAAAAQRHLDEGKHFLAQLDSNPVGFRLLLWAVLESHSDPEVAELVSDVLREQRDIQAAFLNSTPHSDSPEWVQEGAAGLSALAIGFAVQHLVDPDEVTTDLSTRVLGKAIGILVQSA